MAPKSMCIAWMLIEGLCQQVACILTLPGLQELEALRAEGKIRAYGLATWDSFRTPPETLLVS